MRFCKIGPLSINGQKSLKMGVLTLTHFYEHKHTQRKNKHDAVENKHAQLFYFFKNKIRKNGTPQYICLKLIKNGKFH